MVVSTTTPQEMPFLQQPKESSSQQSSRPHILPYAAPIPSATWPVGHRKLPNSPSSAWPPHRKQDTESPGQGEREHHPPLVGKAPSGGLAAPGSSHAASQALPFAPGTWLGSRTAAASVPGRGCQAFSGYKAFLGSRLKHSAADHTAQQSLQLP